MAPFFEIIAARLRLLHGPCNGRNADRRGEAVWIHGNWSTRTHLVRLGRRESGAWRCGVSSGVVWDLAFYFLKLLLSLEKLLFQNRGL